jgi:hypothetical protein
MIVDRIDVPRQGRRLGPMSMIPLRDISTNCNTSPDCNDVRRLYGLRDCGASCR